VNRIDVIPQPKIRARPESAEMLLETRLSKSYTQPPVATAFTRVGPANYARIEESFSREDNTIERDDED
jgi:hypothetical protein